MKSILLLTFSGAALLFQIGCCGVRAVPCCDTACAAAPVCAWPAWPRLSTPRSVSRGSTRWLTAWTPAWCDDCVTRHQARGKARRQLRECGSHSKDFKSGFVQAFEDLADGASGAIPAVPPEKYWTAYYRTPEGQQCAHAWFDGYRAGVDAARLDANIGFNQVAASTDVGSGTAGTFPGPPVVYEQGAAHPSVGRDPARHSPHSGAHPVPLNRPTPVPGSPMAPPTPMPATPMPATPMPPTAASDMRSRSGGGLQPVGAATVQSPTRPGWFAGDNAVLGSGDPRTGGGYGPSSAGAAYQNYRRTSFP